MTSKYRRPRGKPEVKQEEQPLDTRYRCTSKDFFMLGRLPEKPRGDLPGTGGRAGTGTTQKRIKRAYRLSKEGVDNGLSFRDWKRSAIGSPESSTDQGEI